MKKIFVLFVICFLSVVTIVYAGGLGRAGAGGTPEVLYLVPHNDHEVDLTGQAGLHFEWKSLPKPGGGREAYRFELFRGAEEAYDRIYNAELKPDVYSIEIPSDKFEDGMMYTWRVKQRDARSSAWSRQGDRWRFTVRKSAATSPAPKNESETK
ncbi:MAG: hypothetical protein PHI59_10130 [Candidatus Omnitrophica bacterium]|nr:hypothetical protein [Candidatus Omnitrophota bacterium]